MGFLDGIDISDIQQAKQQEQELKQREQELKQRERKTQAIAKCYLMHYLYSCAGEFAEAAERIGIESTPTAYKAIVSNIFGLEKEIYEQHRGYEVARRQITQGNYWFFNITDDGEVEYRTHVLGDSEYSYFNNDFAIIESEWDDSKTEEWSDWDIWFGDISVNPTSKDEAKHLVDDHLKSLLGISGDNIATVAEEVTQAKTLSVLERAEHLSGAMASFVELLRENDVGYSIGGGENTLTYRGFGEQYISIETTQLFNSSSCAMTYLQKDWRKNPFASGDLGNIDISVSEPFTICASVMLPHCSIADENVLQEMIQQIKSLIAQAESSMDRGIQCDSYINTPYMMLTVGFDDYNMQTSDTVFSFMQLFALQVHRILGSITIPSGEPMPSPKSNVAYTPNVQDADGGYFVYGADGTPWWLIDKDLKFKSVIGEGVWKEFKDAEADGLPLTAIDMDNLYRYENGIVYQSDGKIIGRYSADRQS